MREKGLTSVMGLISVVRLFMLGMVFEWSESDESESEGGKSVGKAVPTLPTFLRGITSLPTCWPAKVCQDPGVPGFPVLWIW